MPRLILNFETRGVDERDFFLAAFGDMLFDSPEIFGQPARILGLACATCHNRGDINRRFFIPGISHQPGAADVDGAFFNARFNDHRADSIDTPSLRGIRFTAPYGRDGRFASLRTFTRNVIVNEFGGPEPTPLMLDALITYMNEFDFLPVPELRPDGRLVPTASAAALRGEVLFNRPFAGLGGRACAACHIPSAQFVDRRAHNIGSGGVFDTPTLRGAAFSAPYFHDGALATLDDVVAWFDKRFALDLDAVERADLSTYLKVVGGGHEPYQAFDAKFTRFRLDFEELMTFASTLDTLIPVRDAYHASLVTRSVARDLATDAGTMSNRAALPDIYRLADALSGVGAAIEAARWDEAWRLWQGAKAMHTAIDGAAR